MIIRSNNPFSYASCANYTRARAWRYVALNAITNILLRKCENGVITRKEFADVVKQLWLKTSL